MLDDAESERLAHVSRLVAGYREAARRALDFARRYREDEGAPGGAAPRARAPWMKGMTDTREIKRGSAMGGIERLFVVTTVLVTVAFWLWFAFKAGSPLPSQ